VALLSSALSGVLSAVSGTMSDDCKTEIQNIHKKEARNIKTNRLKKVRHNPPPQYIMPDWHETCRRWVDDNSTSGTQRHKKYIL
jgi:hypothetical protein